MVAVAGLWSGASGPSHLVMACDWGPDSASSRGTPAAISTWAYESSRVSAAAVPASGSQYARLSPTDPTTTRFSSTTAATKVQEAGFVTGGTSAPAPPTAARALALRV